MSVTKTIANFMRETFNVALQLLQIKKHEITHCDVFYITQKEIEKLRGILDPSRTLVGIDALRRVIFVDDSSLYRYKNSNKFVIFMTQNSAKALSFKNACAFTNPFDFKKATEDSDLANDLKDVASEINDMKDGVQKMNPKNMLKMENPLKPKKKPF